MQWVGCMLAVTFCARKRADQIGRYGLDVLDPVRHPGRLAGQVGERVEDVADALVTDGVGDRRHPGAGEVPQRLAVGLAGSGQNGAVDSPRQSGSASHAVPPSTVPSIMNLTPSTCQRRTTESLLVDDVVQTRPAVTPGMQNGANRSRSGSSDLLGQRGDQFVRVALEVHRVAGGETDGGHAGAAARAAVLRRTAGRLRRQHRLHRLVRRDLQQVAGRSPGVVADDLRAAVERAADRRCRRPGSAAGLASAE